MLFLACKWPLFPAPKPAGESGTFFRRPGFPKMSIPVSEGMGIIRRFKELSSPFLKARQFSLYELREAIQRGELDALLTLRLPMLRSLFCGSNHLQRKAGKVSVPRPSFAFLGRR
jgi:hypothetical protein